MDFSQPPSALTQRQRLTLGIVALVCAATRVLDGNITFWFAAHDPVAAKPAAGELASRFQFKKTVMPAAANLNPRNYTAVNPHLKNIATWMSSVGDSMLMTAAAAGVANNMPADLRVSIVDAAGDTSYPISGFTCDQSLWCAVTTEFSVHSSTYAVIMPTLW